MAETKNKKRKKAGTKSATKKTNTKKSVKAKSTKKTTTKNASHKKNTNNKRLNNITLDKLETREPDLEKTILINREDLENRAADMEKTAVIKPEVITEVGEIEEQREEKKLDRTRPPKKGKTRPQTILGLNLPTGKSRKDKKSRIKLYIKDALAFSTIVPAIDLLAMLFIKKYTFFMITNNAVINYLLTLLIDFILIFIVTYIVDYIFGEDAVKRSRK